MAKPRHLRPSKCTPAKQDKTRGQMADLSMGMDVAWPRRVGGRWKYGSHFWWGSAVQQFSDSAVQPDGTEVEHPPALKER